MPLEYKGSLSRYRRYLQTVKERPLVRASLWVAFSLILTIAMILAALKPTLTTISALAGQIEQEQQISNQLDDKIRTIQTAARNLEQINAQLPLLNEAMPNEPNWKDLANRLEKEASESGITVLAFAIQKIPVKGKYIEDKIPVAREDKELLPAGIQKVDINVQATGKYEQFRDFISRLENLRRIIVITSINIDKNEKGQVTLLLNGYALFNNIKT